MISIYGNEFGVEAVESLIILSLTNCFASLTNQRYLKIFFEEIYMCMDDELMPMHALNVPLHMDWVFLRSQILMMCRKGTAIPLCELRYFI